jgi:2-C-methyl-D-erythritol 4-phosphate cytidylyltransferase
LRFNLKKIALIVAGGLGTRMKVQVPKQFLLLKGYPVLMHTLDKFHCFERTMRIILVLPEDQIVVWQNLCRDYRFTIQHEVRTGGETRFHSVKKNLADIPDHCLVAVHDGVRPLVSLETIERCFALAGERGNAIPCIEIPETMRHLDEMGNRQVDRTQYRLIQTPQVFESSILKSAYNREYKPDFTDDAGVVESLGYPIHLVEGNPENIKITLKKDMKIAAYFMKSKTI